MQTEQLIAFFPGASATVTRLRLIAPEHCRVAPFHDENALLDAVTRGRLLLSVVEAGGNHHAAAARLLRRVSEDFPQHPLVAWCDFRRLTSAQVLDVARAGIQEMVRQDIDDGRLAFSRIMASATQRGVGARIVEALDDVLPKRLRPFVEYALEHAHVRLDRNEVAAVFGVSLRTLHGRLTTAGLPATGRFLMWSRLMVAAALLDQPGHTLDSVAGQLGFSDGPNLGNRIRQYTGFGVNRLRAGGALMSMVLAFKAAVHESQVAAVAESTAAALTRS